MSEWSTRGLMHDSDKPENVTDRYIVRKMGMIAINEFETEIDQIPDANVEFILWHWGICLIWKSDIIGWVVSPGEIMGYDVRGLPNRFKPVLAKDIAIDIPVVSYDDAVVIFDTLDPLIKRKDALIWTGDYADVTETIRQQVFNQKTPLIAIAGNKGLVNKLKRSIIGIRDNAKALFIDMDMKDKIQPLDFNAPYNVESLYSYRKSLENEMLEFMGIDNKDGFIKKERLVVDEQEGNDELLNYILGNCLKARQKGIDQLGKFGLSGSTKIAEIVRPTMTNELVEYDDPANARIQAYNRG
jgi:hypothetical protein